MMAITLFKNSGIYDFNASVISMKPLIRTTRNMALILCPGIIISKLPSPEDTFSLMITAPNYPKDI